MKNKTLAYALAAAIASCSLLMFVVIGQNLSVVSGKDSVAQVVTGGNGASDPKIRVIQDYFYGKDYVYYSTRVCEDCETWSNVIEEFDVPLDVMYKYANYEQIEVDGHEVSYNNIFVESTTKDMAKRYNCNRKTTQTYKYTQTIPYTLTGPCPVNEPERSWREPELLLKQEKVGNISYFNNLGIMDDESVIPKLIMHPFQS